MHSRSRVHIHMWVCASESPSYLPWYEKPTFPRYKNGHLQSSNKFEFFFIEFYFFFFWLLIIWRSSTLSSPSLSSKLRETKDRDRVVIFLIIIEWEKYYKGQRRTYCNYKQNSYNVRSQSVRHYIRSGGEKKGQERTRVLCEMIRQS